jgi:hypothetical protein
VLRSAPQRSRSKGGGLLNLIWACNHVPLCMVLPNFVGLFEPLRSSVSPLVCTDTAWSGGKRPAGGLRKNPPCGRHALAGIYLQTYNGLAGVAGITNGERQIESTSGGADIVEDADSASASSAHCASIEKNRRHEPAGSDVGGAADQAAIRARDAARLLNAAAARLVNFKIRPVRLLALRDVRFALRRGHR